MPSYDPGYPAGVRRGPSTFAVIVLSALTSIVASAITVVVMERYGLPVSLGTPQAPKPTIVEVPELVGLKQAAADEILRARELRMVVSEHRNDPAPRDQVIGQSPLASSRVPARDPVTVVLSAGPGLATVPELVGKPLEAAKALVAQAGLSLAELRAGGPGEPGTVTGTTPAAGSQVEPGSAITLDVAQEKKIEVPDVIGLHVRAAKAKISKAGLPVGRVSERYDRRKRSYLVLEQTPSAGAPVAQDTEVSLVINEGD